MILTAGAHIFPGAFAASCVATAGVADTMHASRTPAALSGPVLFSVVPPESASPQTLSRVGRDTSENASGSMMLVRTGAGSGTVNRPTFGGQDLSGDPRGDVGESHYRRDETGGVPYPRTGQRSNATAEPDYPDDLCQMCTIQDLSVQSVNRLTRPGSYRRASSAG